MKETYLEEQIRDVNAEKQERSATRDNEQSSLSFLIQVGEKRVRDERDDFRWVTGHRNQGRASAVICRRNDHSYIVNLCLSRKAEQEEIKNILMQARVISCIRAV